MYILRNYHSYCENLLSKSFPFKAQLLKSSVRYSNFENQTAFTLNIP